jgi:Ion channel
VAAGADRPRQETRGDARVAEETQPGNRPVRELAARHGRFGLLLLVLVVTYLLSAFNAGRWVDVVQVVLFTTAGILALRNASVSRRTLSLILACGVIVSVVMIGLAVAVNPARGVVHIWTGLLLLGTVVVIVRRVLSFGTVTLQSIYGALSAYLVIGLMFASFFAAINDLGSEDFFVNHEPASTQTFQYFSFTTLTTLGYGDFTAAGNGGRAVAILEALTGQIFLATLVARLVAAYRSPSDRQG